MRSPVAGAALACVGFATLAAACTYNDPNAETIVWEAQLTAGVTHPGLRGQVAVVAQLNGTDAGIGITGADSGAIHTWRIRIGRCAAPGAGIGPEIDYPVLAVDELGEASAETHLGPRLSGDSTYHGEVRESVTDTSRIACGDLQRQ